MPKIDRLAEPSDYDWWLDFYVDKKWKFARTMSSTPHSYLVRFKTISDEDWSRWYGTLVNFGLPGKFNGRPNIYLHGPDVEVEPGLVHHPRWWTMEMKDHAENLILNYATDGKTYGVQDVPMLRSSQWAPYDAVAPWYDYRIPIEQSDRSAMWRLMNDEFDANYDDQVLDIGAGQGGSYASRLIRPDRATALEPSTGMLHNLWIRYPQVKAHIPASLGELLDWQTGQTWDRAVASFGTASQLSEREIARLPELVRASGKIFLSFYRDRVPGYLEQIGIEALPAERAMDLLKGAELRPAGQFDVVVASGTR